MSEVKVTTEEDLLRCIKKLESYKETYINSQNKHNLPISEDVLSICDEDIETFKEELKSYEKLKNIQNEDYSGLYATNDSDIIMLADDLSAIDTKVQKEAEGTALMVKNSFEATKENIEELGNIIDLTSDEYTIQQDKKTEVSREELEKMYKDLIAEHPIRFILSQTSKSIVEGIKNTIEAICTSIKAASEARKCLYDKQYEYEHSKTEAVLAVRKMGKENYPIINPTRLLTLETIQNKVNSIANTFIDMNKSLARHFAKMNTLNKSNFIKYEYLTLGTYSEAIKDSEKYKNEIHNYTLFREQYKPSFMLDQIEKYKDLADNTNSKVKKEYYEEMGKILQENYDYVTSPKLVQDCWKDGISPEVKFQDKLEKTKTTLNNAKNTAIDTGKTIYKGTVSLYQGIKSKTKEAIEFIKTLDIDEIKEKFIEKAESYLNHNINDYNRMCDTVSKFLINDVDFYRGLDTNLNMKQIKYEKAAEEVGAVQKKISQSLDILGSLKQQNSMPINDAEITKNVELMKQIDALREVNGSDIVLDTLYANLQKQCTNKSKIIAKAENKNRKTEIKATKKEIKDNKKELKAAESKKKALEKEKKKLLSLEGKRDSLNSLKNKIAGHIINSKVKEVSFVDRSKELLTAENIKDAIDNQGYINGNSAIAVQCEKEYCSIDTLNKTISMGVNNQAYETFKIKDFNIIDNKLYVDIIDGKNILENDVFISSNIIDIDYDASIQFDRDKKNIVDILNHKANIKVPDMNAVNISTDLGKCTIDLKNNTISSKDFDLKNEPIKSAVEKVNTISFELNSGQFELPRMNNIDKILNENEKDMNINNENNINMSI